MPSVARWASVLVVMSVLWWSSSRSPVPGPSSLVAELAHNAMHLVAFGALAATAWCASRGASQSQAGLVASIAIGIAVGYGIVDELHQGHVPGRVCSVYDVLTDACGASGTVWLLRLVQGESRPAAWIAALFLLCAALSVTLATFF